MCAQLEQAAGLQEPQVAAAAGPTSSCRMLAASSPLKLRRAAGQAGLPVVSCYINQEKRFAFVEFRTVEECSNVLAMDGMGYRGAVLRVCGRVLLCCKCCKCSCMNICSSRLPLRLLAWLELQALGWTSLMVQPCLAF